MINNNVRAAIAVVLLIRKLLNGTESRFKSINLNNDTTAFFRAVLQPDRIGFILLINCLMLTLSFNRIT